MGFEPIKEHGSMLSFTLKYTLNQKWDEKKYPGSAADGDLDAIIRGYLVGLQNHFDPVLPRVISWLDKAIAGEESLGTLNFHQERLHRARGIASWLKDSINQVEDWRAAGLRNLAYKKGELANPKSPNTRTFGTTYLDDYMGYAFQAGEYEAGIAEFEKYHGPQDLKLKNIMTPKALGYILCLHKVRGRGSPEEMMEAGRKILKLNLDRNWLSAGATLNAAMWLKIVYWHADPSLSPLETLLKAYDDMKHVPRPDFV
jgi:hypothetical protein